MNEFWQGFNFAFENSMFNNMFSFFSPCGCSYLGINTSIFGMGNFGLNNLNFCSNLPFTTCSYDVAMPMISYADIGTNSAVFNINYANNNFDYNNGIKPQFGIGNYSPTLATPDIKSEQKPKEEIVITPTAKELYEKWSKKQISKEAELSEEFCQKVINIANKVNCDANDLMILMYNECRFNPHKPNKTNATENIGLIQFGIDARKDVGIPGKNDAERKAALMKMNSMEQLEYVEKYFVKTRYRLHKREDEKLTLGDVLAVALRPATADQEIVIDKNVNKSQRDAYNANYQLDTDNDGKITKKELVARARNKAGE